MVARRNCMTLRHTVWSVIMVPVLCILSSCTVGQSRAVSPDPLLSWPMPSGEHRVVWIKNIAGPGDLNGGSGFWHRVLNVVTGEKEVAIQRPYGVLRTEHELYLTDPGRGVVHRFDIAGGKYSQIGGPESGLLRSPIGLTADDAGFVYITDSSAGMVYRFNPKNSALTPFLKNALKRPTGIVFSPLNEVFYVADTLSSQIAVIDREGNERRRIGRHGTSRSGLNRPTDLAIDTQGQIYVTDSLNFRITVLSPEGQVVRQFGAPGDAQEYFSRPKGIAVDSDGNIYVSDSLMDSIKVFGRNGDVRLVVGWRGTAPGQFWLPSGIFIDRHNQIYVVDTYNKRIQVFRYLVNGVSLDGEPVDLFDVPLTP